MVIQTNGFLLKTLKIIQKKLKKSADYKEPQNKLTKYKIKKKGKTLAEILKYRAIDSERRKKSYILAILLSLYTIAAPVMQALPVYGEAAEVLSVWEVMATQLVGANAIITDQAVVNAYSSALGSIAADGATAEVINIGLSNAAQACGVDLAPLFANTVESAASVGIEASAASAGENLAATAAACAAGGGYASIVLPALGGVCVAAGAAFIVGGITHICNMCSEMYRNAIECNTNLKNYAALQNVMPYIVPGGSLVIVRHLGTIRRTVYPAFWCMNSDGSTFTVYQVNPTSEWIMSYSSDYDGGNLGREMGPYSMGANWANSPVQWNEATGSQFSDVATLQQYLADLRDGIIEPPLSYCPDLASTNGYQTYDPDATPENNPDVIIPNLPELKPLPDYYNETGLSPIREMDYQSIVTYINNYPKPTTREDQEEIPLAWPEEIRPYIEPYITPIVPTHPDPEPTGTPNPDPTGTPDPDPNPTGTPDPNPTGTPDPNPTGTPDPNPNPNPNPRPTTVPYPDPETNPQPTPVVNPLPDSEIVPVPVPYPEPDSPTQEETEDTNDKITPYDLRDKFPFCIPFDIVKVMKLFNRGGREAPHFIWTLDLGSAGTYTIDIDMAPWDSIATLLRSLELIVFIVLLAVGTRNLLGGSG